jgi:hypothetical protein
MTLPCAVPAKIPDWGSFLSNELVQDDDQCGQMLKSGPTLQDGRRLREKRRAIRPAGECDNLRAVPRTVDREAS